MNRRRLREFARSMRIERPVVWGSVESQILAMPVPRDEVEETLPSPAPAPVSAAAVIVLTLAPATLGLALVVWATVGASALPEWFATLLAGTFVAATAVMAAPGLTIVPGRRDGGQVVAVPIAVAVALATFAMLLATSSPWSETLPWFVLAAIGAGIFSTVQLLRARRARHAAADPARLSPGDRWRMDARAFILDELLRRGEIDAHAVDRDAMAHMQLGSWRDLDESTHRRS